MKYYLHQKAICVNYINVFMSRISYTISKNCMGTIMNKWDMSTAMHLSYALATIAI